MLSFFRHISSQSAVRESASLIVVQRNTENATCLHGYNYKLLFVKRNQKMKSWPGALTFPGGVIEKLDFNGIKDFTPVDLIRPSAHKIFCKNEIVYRKGAIRELIEETNFPSEISTENIIPWSIWKTPLSIKNRFNTLFYIYFTEKQDLDMYMSPQFGEVESLHWLSPGEALNDSKNVFAPPQITDLHKFLKHLQCDALHSFSEERYSRFETSQCTPVLVKFNDGISGILHYDSFYETALEMQEKDTSGPVKINANVMDNTNAQERKCRSILTNSRKSFVISQNVSYDGHILTF